MKSILTFLFCMMLSGVYAQVNSYPYSQSFEDPFTTGRDVFFLPHWFGNYVTPDSMGQYAYGHSGNYSLYMIPEGEEFRTMAQVYLDLTGKSNTVAEFWVATRKNGTAEDQKRVKLNLAISIDGGLTFPYTEGIGSHEGFLNEDTEFEKFEFIFPVATNDQTNVVFRLIGKSGGGPHLPAILLIDDVGISQAAADTFPPYILGDEPIIPSLSSIVIPFSEPLHPDSALLLTHYNFTWPEEEDGTPIVGDGPLPQVANITLSTNSEKVTLSLDPPLIAGQSYMLEMYNITDLNGNAADTLVMEGLVYNIPLPGSLVISEVLFADPSPVYPTEKLQYVEIYNPTTETIPLGGLRIKGSISAHDLPNIKLKPGEFWVATRNAASYYATFGKTAWEWKGSWIEYDAEEGEVLEPQSLYIQTTDRHGGALVDSIGFDFNDPAWIALRQLGYSVEVCNNLSDNVNVNNWSLASTTGTAYHYVVDGYTYTIYATPGSGCATATQPVVDVGPDGNRCGIESLVLDAGNAGSNYLWSTDAETQTIEITSSGTYWVMVNNGIGVSYDTITVTFVPAIVASAVAPSEACQSTEISFTDESVGAITWLWTFGDGTTSDVQNPAHTYANDGTYAVTLTVHNEYGCEDVYTSEVEVYINEIDWELPELVCEGTEAGFSDNTESAVSWLWNFGDESTSEEQNPAHTYATAAAYTVSLTVTNSFGCSSTVSESVTVNPNTIAWSLPELFCAHNAAGFTDNSVSATSWLWSFGDEGTSNEQQATHTYATAGEYTVSLTVGNSYGCTSTKSTGIDVKTNEVSWTLPVLTQCTYTDIEFSDNSTEASSWAWNFGDGGSSTAETAVHSYTHPGEYAISLTVINTNGCVGTLSETMLVDICVGLDEQNADAIEVYPNPSRGLITLKLDLSSDETGVVRILNVEGRTVWQEQIRRTEEGIHTMDVSSLRDGLYTMRIQVGGQSVTRRFVLKK